MIATIIRLLAGLFLFGFVFGHFFGISGIWWASYLSEAAGVVYALLFTIIVFKKKTKKFDVTPQEKSAQ